MTPYDKIVNPDGYWSVGVLQHYPNLPKNIYKKKFSISKGDIIASAGSCFAQHIARFLKIYGYNVLDCEPPPFGLSSENSIKFNYGVYSCRFGNIYHVRQLFQLLQAAVDDNAMGGIEYIWERNGRFYDALRPGIEPFGLRSPEEVMSHRKDHLRSVKRMFLKATVFIFTMGLTEAWTHRETGVVYPNFPGVYGCYDPKIHKFINFRVDQIYNDFVNFYKLVKRINNKFRFILTVFPIPLIATATHNHVLSATTYSKSILRCVAGQLFEDFDDIDYFPSYEIITSSFHDGMLWGPDLRNVTNEGIATVMEAFFSQHNDINFKGNVTFAENDETICDEILLETFSK